MKSVRLFFLFFLLLEAFCCEGCLKEEKQALSGLHSRLGNSLYWDEDTDCCEWEGVQCNSSTGRVAGLDIFMSDSIPQQYINYSDFSVFIDLKNLSLLNGNIVGCVGDEGMNHSNFIISLYLLHIIFYIFAYSLFYITLHTFQACQIWSSFRSVTSWTLLPTLYLVWMAFHLLSLFI